MKPQTRAQNDLAPGWEHFPHQADVGVHARARQLAARVRQPEPRLRHVAAHQVPLIVVGLPVDIAPAQLDVEVVLDGRLQVREAFITLVESSMSWTISQFGSIHLTPG